MSKLLAKAKQHEEDKRRLSEQVDELRNSLESKKMESAVADHLKEKNEKLAKKYEDAKVIIDQEKEKRKELTLKMAR